MPFLYQQAVYHGKVRDVYQISNNYLLMIVSDRISAFDVILPIPIPYKGQVLNQLAAYHLEQTKTILPNWLISTPAPQASFGIRCEPIPIEMVVRATLTGHAWRTYASGQRILCGVEMPDGMKEHDFFPAPIITPSTKAHQGHDEDISRDEIIKRGIVSEERYAEMEGAALSLFEKGNELAQKSGLILADTKYEFGIYDDKLYLMDEIHTPDSSRYFYAEGFEERQRKGEKQKQLSKEFVREWLIQNGFMGREGQTIPEMTDEVVESISKRYIELYEVLIQKKFIPMSIDHEMLEEQINQQIAHYLH
jgi:phosphoribosylaminoimidazole-succinocarboxamide synthase (EC 6.3.2.6)